MATNYLDMLDAVRSYYGSGSDQWASIAQYGVTDQNWQYLTQVPGVKVTVSASGKYLGYDYTNPFPATTNPGAIVDSNVQTGQYGVGSFDAQLPSTAVVDQQTGLITQFDSGLKSVSMGNTVASIATDVGLAVGATALGIKLGKFIDSALYSLDPNWWDEHYPYINPSSWDDIITPDMEGAPLFRAIFGIEDDNTTMYLDEKTLAYSYAALLASGAYDQPGVVLNPSKLPDRSVLNYPNYNYGGLQISLSGGTYATSNNQYFTQTLTQPDNSILYLYQVSGNTYVSPYIISNAVKSYPVITPKDGTGNTSSITYRYITYYGGSPGNTPQYNYNWLLPINIVDSNYASNFGKHAWDIAYLYYHNAYDEGTPVEGISDNPDAGIHISPSNVINPNTGVPITPQDSIDDILNALKLAYPDLFNGSIYEDVLQPDGTIDRHTYIPTPMPEADEEGNPVTKPTPGVDPQQNPEVNPENTPESELQNITDDLTESPTTPDTGSGTTPPFLPPDGTANALYAIYNPSQGELNSFGAWLWSSNFVDQLLKLFNDPMQAIIGLHKVFVNPVISGRQNIKVGYLDSGVASNVVGAQYVTVDCGSVSIPEYFGNVFDYDPFTQIYLYLPFVGIQRLDTGDVMRGTLNVVYHCDVLTGACLVEVNVFRDGGGGIIYTYTGNCAVQYPISSGSYMGIIASLASVVGGVVGTIATGGALAPVALGAVSGVMNAHTRVEHSGGFSGNAGAMGIKKPYVIITRPQTCLADNFPAFNGYPANKLTYIADCTGYIKCDECHIEQIPGTDAELSELENLLKSGIII